MKKLIKSYRFWSALAGAVGLLVVNIAKLFGYTMSSVAVEELIMAICGVLVVFGIVAKPEQTDKKEEEKAEKISNETTMTPEKEDVIENSKEKEEQSNIEQDKQ